MRFISQFGQSFMNVATATARHVAFRSEVVAASKMNFTIGFTKNILSNVALGVSVKTILNADQNGLVESDEASNIFKFSRYMFRFDSLKNKAVEVINLFKDAKINLQQNDFDHLVINSFSLSKMIFGTILPDSKMAISLLSSAYDAGVNAAYPEYENKMIGHLDIDDENDMVVISSLQNVYDQDFNQSELIGLAE